jgi:hypothetical protein
MSKDVFITIVEMAISILIEGVLISWIFAMFSAKSQAKMETKLKDEMATMENQIKFDYDQLTQLINGIKTDILNEIKESAKGGQSSDAKNV